MDAPIMMNPKQTCEREHSSKAVRKQATHILSQILDWTDQTNH